MTTLAVKYFAHIEHATIQFGDLTVLVGPQASGKSLLLQWLKVAVDVEEIITSLKQAGHDVTSQQDLLDLIFGEGMAGAWKTGKTEVRFNQIPIVPQMWVDGVKKKQHGEVFFIPAHRALLLTSGWPSPFLSLTADTPVVARLFSQNLYQRFSGRAAAPLFPLPRILKEEYRQLIDQAVFHGGQVDLDKKGLRYQLRLGFEDLSLPFMTWTAGQREFTPLLLGLYHVLPSRTVKKRQEVDWVVIEEPEMGLHPQAIAVVMLLVLDLLWRGYKVVLSTHAPLVLDIVWAIRRLSAYNANWKLLAQAFQAEETPAIQKVLRHALQAEYRVYFMKIDQKTRQVTTHDISQLDPEATDEAEANWGGLTGFSSRFGDAVRAAVIGAEG